VTSRLGTGKPQIFFYSVATHIPLSPRLSVRCVSGGGSIKISHVAVQNTCYCLKARRIFFHRYFIRKGGIRGMKKQFYFFFLLWKDSNDKGYSRDDLQFAKELSLLTIRMWRRSYSSSSNFRANSGMRQCTVKKKVGEFPVPSRDVTTKLSLGGNNDVITELLLPRGSLVSDIPAGGGKLVNLFFRCGCSVLPGFSRCMVYVVKQ
jgi:hypothetical protein